MSLPRRNLRLVIRNRTPDFAGPSRVRRCAILIAAISLTAADVATSARADSPRIERLRQRFTDAPGDKQFKLLWGGDPEGGAPYQFEDPARPGQVSGFEVEVIEAVVDQMRRQLDLPKLEASFQQYDWDKLPLGLEKGDFDLIASGMEVTPENRAKMIFSRPYYHFAQQLTVRADETRINSIADCRELPVGTMGETAAHRLLLKEGCQNIKSFDGQIEPYQDLLLGRVDAVLLDWPIAVYNAFDNPKMKSAGERVGRYSYGIGIRRNDEDLAAAVDEALGEVIASGKLREILTKWRIWNDDQLGLASVDRPGEAAGLTKSGDVQQYSSSQSNYTFGYYFPLLLKAAVVTVELSILSMAVAMTVGLIVAVCRLYGPTPVKWLALAYVEFFRGTPLLLLLTFLYFGLPHVPYVGVQLTSWQAAILGFGLNYAAFEAEIYRSSILAVPVGQWEASQALGMTDVAAFRRIIFPQAFRTALGPMTNDFVAMFKDTSLVSVLAVVELTRQYDLLSRSSLKFVEIGALTAALYLAMSVPLGYLARYLEHRWSQGLN